VVGATGHQPLARHAFAGGQRIGPAFGSIGPLVVGEPHVEPVHIGPSAEPLAQRGLVGIGEPAPAVNALAGAMLEADVQGAAGAQGAPQAIEGGRHGGQRHVQQTGAAPDAVERFNFVDILEASRRDLEPAVGAGQTRQFCGRVEGRDLEASLGEGLGIATRAAARIEDVGARRQLCQEPLLDRCHVHADGRAEELGRELVVVMVGGVHPWQWLRRCRFGCQRTRRSGGIAPGHDAAAGASGVLAAELPVQHDQRLHVLRQDESGSIGRAGLPSSR
jgi:hypothetical protein